MLSELLGPLNLDDFRRDHLQGFPYATAGTAARAVPLFGWHTLDGVLGGYEIPDVLTVARGALVPAPRPRGRADVARLVDAGVSVVVRAAERHDRGLAELAAGFSRALPGEVHVQLYVTPGGSNSYGWHFDFEDVFIAQTAGSKDYYFRRNTVARDARLGERLDFQSIRREVTPIHTARLLAGDFLYIPATWWHLVTCVEVSLSISVGVMPPAALARAVRVPPGWTAAGQEP